MTAQPGRTVFVVDDDAAVRESLRLLLGTAGLEVETYSSAHAFLQRFEPERPGALLLDVRMPGMSGLDLQDELNERGAQLPILFITGHGDVPMAVDAIKKGAVDFLEKPFEHYQILCKVLDALDQGAQRQDLDAERERAASLLAQLTERERQVLDGIIEGRSTRSIAEVLFISARTVDFHRARIREKLGVSSLSELLRVCAAARRRPPE